MLYSDMETNDTEQATNEEAIEASKKYRETNKKVNCFVCGWAITAEDDGSDVCDECEGSDE